MYSKVNRYESVYIEPKSFEISNCDLPDQELNYYIFDSIREESINALKEKIQLAGYKLGESEEISDIVVTILMLQCNNHPAGYIGMDNRNIYAEANTIVTVGFLGLVPVVHYDATGTYLILKIKETKTKVNKSYAIQLYGSGLVSIFYLPTLLFGGFQDIRRDRLKNYLDTLIYLINNRNRIDNQVGSI
jgi:hypothetical protein